jgi:hypothetical protein
MDEVCASDVEFIIEDEMRPYLRHTLAHQLSLIASAEGIGKTKTTMQEMLESADARTVNALDDLVEPPPGETASQDTRSPSGFLAVACRSYEQAQKKCLEFNERMASGTGFHGVVVHSFERIFQEIFLETSINREWAARQGFKTAMEAAHSDPGTAAKLNEIRWRIQAELGWIVGWAIPEWRTDHARRAGVIIFTVHAVVQNWYRQTGTRFWIHPLFERWAAARAAEDIDTTRQIAKQIKDDTQLSWVLHDEIGISDLMVQHEKAKVDAATRFVEWANQEIARANDADKKKSFEKLSLPEKWELFEIWLPQRLAFAASTLSRSQTQQNAENSPVTFEEVLQIHEIGYTDQDLRVVEPALEPFGINNSPESPYLSIKGQQYYAKLRDWWEHVRYKLTVTTTERKMLAAFDYIRAQQLSAIEQDPEYGPQLRAWRAETAHLGPDDWVPPKPETPKHLLPRWCVNEYPATDHLPPDSLRVQIYLDDRARVPRKNDPGRSSVEAIYNDIKASDPNAIIISNCLPEKDAMTPARTKGGKRLHRPADLLYHVAPGPRQISRSADRERGI